MTKTSENIMERLRQFLQKIPPGTIPAERQPDLWSVLYDVWDKIEGGAKGKMTKDKIYRAKTMEWSPPILSFVVGRHGAFVNGSSKEEFVGWNVDVSTGKAVSYDNGYRQLRPKDRILDVKVLVANIVTALSSGQDHGAITRKSDAEIALHVGVIIPDVWPKQTVAGRRKRFRTELVKMMAIHGWIPKQKSRAYIFIRSQKDGP